MEIGAVSDKAWDAVGVAASYAAAAVIGATVVAVLITVQSPSPIRVVVIHETPPTQDVNLCGLPSTAQDASTTEPSEPFSIAMPPDAMHEIVLSPDTRFIRALERQGWAVYDDAGMISLGRQQCDSPSIANASAALHRRYGWRPDAARDFATDAVAVYCPQYAPLQYTPGD